MIIDMLNSINHEAAGMISVVLCVSFYVMCKAVLWWFLFGTGHLIFGNLTLKEWRNKTIIGFVWGVVIVALNVLIICLSNHYDNQYYFWSLIVVLLLAMRILWREFFTIGGLLRGDWHPLHPQLRFFAWNTFNVFFIFKPFKLLQSPFRTTNEQSKETPWGSMVDFCEWVYSYRQVGNVS